jgi:hypothetical protein
MGSKISAESREELEKSQSVQLQLQEILSRPPPDGVEDLDRPPTTLPMDFAAAGLEKGIDIFEGPSAFLSPATSSLLGQQAQQPGASYAHIIAFRPEELAQDSKRLDLLLADLARADESMHELVLDSFRDLLLSGSFMYLMRNLNQTLVDESSRLLCAKVINKATTLTAELGALVKTESVRHLQTIHDICDVAATYQQDEVRFLEEMDRCVFLQRSIVSLRRCLTITNLLPTG